MQTQMDALRVKSLLPATNYTCPRSPHSKVRRDRVRDHRQVPEGFRRLLISLAWCRELTSFQPGTKKVRVG